MNGNLAAQTQLNTRPTTPPMASGVLQRQCACGQHTSAGGECKACKQKRGGTLQRAAISPSPVHDVPPIVHEVLRSPGQPLDAKTRALMEPRFGRDFSQVRVHADAKAVESARAVHALAYTVGSDIAFGRGRYAPGNREGQKLLAHELAHVVQQSKVAQFAQSHLRIDAPDSKGEKEADAASSAMEQDLPAIGVTDGYATLARQLAADTPESGAVNRTPQVECVKRLGGCANTRPGGIPSSEEIATYNTECRGETGYTGEDVTPTDDECRGIMPPPSPTSVFLCSKDLETSPLGTHAFFRVGGTGTGQPTFSLEPEDRGSDCFQGEPKRNFPADVNAAAQCEPTSLALSCIEAQFAAYPIGHYCALGPNSNTFVGHIARNCGMSNPDPPGWNPGIDDSPPPAGTFAPSPMNTLLLGCRTKECS